MLPFFVESNIPSVRLFELSDGRFQLLEVAEIAPFLPGYGYLLVERRLAEFLVEHDVERIVCEDAVLFDRTSGKEFRTHVQVRVRQYFKSEQINDLDIAGLRLLTMNDEYYFISPELKNLLEQAPFEYLSFREGLSGFAGTDT
ncbi:hypothetical protein [Janthinobacterium fluminis]|uniref:Uncharacterized protein n=1 Tax=Janthinobacterium fluminis TaxID=2987524 RepID=A0ABT5JZ28_9BURK|nr:hypothetical protein [Janthinobacterium fluminis]MDC8757301.1 hypothetical protein [Janthinobacterium fluminis]